MKNLFIILFSILFLAVSVSADILQTAEDLIGKETGTWDCSGFTQHVYSVNGITIPRTSGEQYSQGAESTGAAGDIVCWKGHVGICDGQGNVIHSYNANHNIRKDKISDVSKWDGREVLGYVKFE